MFSICSFACFKQGGVDNNEFRPIHIAAMVMDVITGIALTVIAALSITGILPSIPLVSYLTLAGGAFTLSPFLLLGLWILKQMITPKTLPC